MFARSREAFLRKAEAEADLKELDVAERRFHLDRMKTDYVLKLTKQLPDEESRQAVQRFVLDAIRDALGPKASNDDVAASSIKLLGPIQASIPGSLESDVPRPEPVRTSGPTSGPATKQQPKKRKR